jgi:hypothetical protein
MSRAAWVVAAACSSLLVGLVYLLATSRPPASGASSGDDTVPATVIEEPLVVPAEEPSPAGDLVETVGQEDRRVPMAKEARAPGSGDRRIRGRFVDRTTSEAIPDLGVFILLGEKPVEHATTDADGRFVSEGEFEPGTYAVEPFDRPLSSTKPDQGWHWSPIEHEHRIAVDGSAVEQEHPLWIGPTYRLELRGPAEVRLADLYAELVEPTPGDEDREDSRAQHRMMQELENPLVAQFMGAGLDPADLGLRVPIREVQPPWVRFGSAPMGDHPDELTVQSSDGTWSGSAPIDSTLGVHPTVVVIELSRRGVLQGVVTNPSGKPVPSAWIELALARETDVLRATGADASGGFTFGGLAPGAYRIVVPAERYREWSAIVEVEAGSTKQVPIVLASAGDLGIVSGSTRSRTGRHRSKGGVLTLQSARDPTFFFVKVLSYRREKEEYVAPFSFEDLPIGEYELTLEPLDNMRWDGLQRVVTAPAEEIVFLCEDDTVVFDLDFRALDAETGEPVEPFGTLVWQGSPKDDRELDRDFLGAASELHMGTTSGLHRYLGVPENAPLRWIVGASGYRLAMGDQTDMRVEGNVRVVEAQLLRGWGQVFRVTTEDHIPLANVELHADGLTVGSTDEQGIVLLDVEAMPAKLEFLRAGWHVSWGRTEPSEAAFDLTPETPVYLSPDTDR